MKKNKDDRKRGIAEMKKVQEETKANIEDMKREILERFNKLLSYDNL